MPPSGVSNPADCALFDAAPWVSYQPLATAAYAFPVMLLPLGEKCAQLKIYFVLDRLYGRIVFDGEVQLRRLGAKSAQVVDFGALPGILCPSSLPYSSLASEK